MVAHIFHLEEFRETFYRLRLENNLDRSYLQIEHQIGSVYLLFWEIWLLVRHISESKSQAQGLLDSIALKLLNERNAQVVLQDINSKGLVLELNLNWVRVVLIWCFKEAHCHRKLLRVQLDSVSWLTFEGHLELSQRKVDAHIRNRLHLERKLTSHLFFKL